MHSHDTSLAAAASGRPEHQAWRICGINITVPAHASSVARLRKHAGSMFGRWAMSDDERATAELVISELLTNAVVHGRDMMTLAVAFTGSTLDIEVVDYGGAGKAVQRSGPDDHGRGLTIVAALSQLHIDAKATGWRARACMNLLPRRPRALPESSEPWSRDARQEPRDEAKTTRGVHEQRITEPAIH
jgi:anti-sigma regulatory factor (Ser/Thr protein kinase)